MRILGIETSCDETGTAVIEGEGNDKKVRILSNVIASSLTLHSKTGGIIPEIAAREQVKYIIPVIKKALLTRHSGEPEPVEGDSRISLRLTSKRTIGDSGQARMTGETIDAIAVTIGPGLIGSLLVGVETAKTLSYVWQKPIIPVNHLIGHIYANFVGENPKSEIRNPILDARRYELNANIEFPALALIVSGGHTDLVLMRSHGKIKWLGGTRDDAAGEALDKIGRLLNLPYPGGPAIESAAKNGNAKAFNFPRPMIDSDDLDFSFSGLKTAVLYLIKKDPKVSVILGRSSAVQNDDSRISQRTDVGDSGRSASWRIARMTNEKEQLLSDLSASVQQAIIDVLISKTLKATQKYKVKSILLSGGVAANEKLRNQFQLKIENLKLKISLSVPPKHLCTDNGAMIATAAFFNYKPVPWRKITANPELYFD